MNKKERICRNYFRAAVRDLRGNQHLSGYLLGLAHAWRLVGAISDSTYQEMENKTKQTRDEGRNPA